MTDKQVPCPTCKRPAVFGLGNPYRPFCTERCRSADLGAWANEAFRLPDETQPELEPKNPPHQH